MKRKANKIVLLGDSGVGKTCVVVRLIKEVFQEPDAPTIGASFFKKTVKKSDGTLMDIEMWDTAGQEKYDSLSKFYCRGAVGAILVYDVTRKQTLVNVRRWEKKLKMVATGCFVILVGNKTDLVDQRDVTTAQGEDLKEELGAVKYVETSCLLGDNLSQLMNSIIDNIEEVEQGNVVTTAKLDLGEYAASKSGCCKS